MRWVEFEALAWQQWDRVPAEFKAGVDGLVIERDARAHARFEEIFTLGECVTESFPSAYGGPDTTRSAVVLYYGSFLRLAHLDPSFDWEHELWETITHELQHHLEALAAEDSLEEFDYAVDENYKRMEGEPFDPFFYRQGQPAGANAWQVEEDIFVEVTLRAHTAAVEVEYGDARFRFNRPHDLGDLCFVTLDGALAEPQQLIAVLLPERGMLEVMKGVLRPRRARIVETEAVAEPVARDA